MQDLPLLEEYYKKFSKNMFSLIPEGIYFINLELLQHFDLLHFQPDAQYTNTDSVLAQHFYVIESAEKITLLNDEFLIWIISERDAQTPTTSALIALNHDEHEPTLEAAFIASGIYNSSALILKVLEKFLSEIHDTEKTLMKFQKEP